MGKNDKQHILREIIQAYAYLMDAIDFFIAGYLSVEEFNKRFDEATKELKEWVIEYRRE